MASIAIAATPGTVATTSTTSVVATVATFKCTLANQQPVNPAGFQVTCNNLSVPPTLLLTTSSPVAPGTQGVIGSLTSGGDTVTWAVLPAATGTLLSWQVVANGTLASGSF